jgi:ATP-dependent DNA helicase RecG
VHFVEKWGTGIGKIKKLEPKTMFEEVADFFLVTFERRNVPEDRLNRIKQLITDNNTITIPKIAEIIKVTEKTIKRDIAKLKESGIIKRIGPDKGGHWEIRK